VTNIENNPPEWVHELLSQSAGRDASAPFLIAPKRTYSYGEVEARSNQAARWLVDSGVAVGDRVAILATNTAEYVTAYYAVSKARAIAVPVNTAVDGASLRYVLEDCGAMTLLFEAKFLEVVTTGLATAAEASTGGDAPAVKAVLLTTIPDPEDPGNSGRGAGAASRDDADSPASWSIAWNETADPIEQSAVPGDSPASIIYTSGSTGRPRGATLSHKNILANTASIISYLKLTAGDRMMVILPFYYVYGKSLLNTHAAVGGSLIIGTDLYFPNSVVKRMHKESATGFAGVPSSFTVLLSRSNLAAETPPSLRYLTQAGGAMAPELTRQVLEHISGVDLFIMYGATEASARLSYLAPHELPEKVGSIGKAIPGVTLQIVDDSGLEVGVGEQGELVARGDNIMLGYWNDPEETELVLKDGRLHPGDLAKRDEDGFLYIVGRKKEMIKSGAHRVSPQEIEEVLVSHPRVLEAAVIGVPDVLLGEAIRAFVVLDGDRLELDQSTLIEWTAERLPEYKVPRHVEFPVSLPKNETGKIQKRVLRDLVDED